MTMSKAVSVSAFSFFMYSTTSSIYSILLPYTFDFFCLNSLMLLIKYLYWFRKSFVTVLTSPNSTYLYSSYTLS
jgi:hypothetical protein